MQIVIGSLSCQRSALQQKVTSASHWGPSLRAGPVLIPGRPWRRSSVGWIHCHGCDGSCCHGVSIAVYLGLCGWVIGIVNST